MRKRVTIITGAGFTLGSDFGAPSTAKITSLLRSMKIEGYSIAGKLPGEYLYRKLCYHYTRKTKHDCDISIVNFETIIHLLEEMYAHLTSYNPASTASKKSSLVKHQSKFKGVKPAFLILKESIRKDLTPLKKTTRLENLSSIVKNIYQFFVDAIVKLIIPLNSDTSNKGMKSFETNLLDSYLSADKFIRRVYTLNYDTWLNKYLNFHDGFNTAGKFDSDKVMKDSNYDCHYNLHGSIMWQNDLGSEGVKKLKKPVQYLSYSQSSAHAINREPLIATPIITGYNKMSRMKYSPYLQMYYALQNDIINSDLIIIIGYGFSDTHINNILSLAKCKTLVIGYISEWLKSETDAKSSGEEAYFDRWDEEITSNYSQVSPINGGFAVKESEIQKGWITTREGNTKYWWRGIGTELYNAFPKILDDF